MKFKPAYDDPQAIPVGEDDRLVGFSCAPLAGLQLYNEPMVRFANYREHWDVDT